MVFNLARTPVEAGTSNGLGDLYEDTEGPHYGDCDEDFHHHEGDYYCDDGCHGDE